MQAITKVFSDIVKPYIDTVKQTLTQQINVSDAKNLCPTMNPSDPLTLESWSNYFTINADGSITANGTPSGRVSIASRVVLPAGQYIMNGCPSGGYWNTYRIIFLKYTPSETIVYADAGSTPTTVTLEEETEIVIRVDLYENYTASNLVYKPMICLKSAYDLDPSYAPPAKTNQELTRDKVGMDLLSEVGAVNLHPLLMSTDTENGVLFTVNSDETVSLSGTSTSSFVHYGGFAVLKKGTYRISGNAIDTRDYNADYALSIRDSNGTILGSTVLNPIFTLSQDANCRFGIYVKASTNTDGSVFKPMISPVSYTGEYVPYAKSNKELTEIVDPLKTQFDADHSIVGIFNNEMNVFLTDNALPSDWSNLTTQQATDITQALYDVFKKIGGSAGKRYSGSMIIRYKKASDSSALGTATGLVDIYSNVNYNSMLSNNANARFTMVFHQYGSTVQAIYALWSNSLLFSQHGIDVAGTVMDSDKKYTYNTISTYKG